MRKTKIIGVLTMFVSLFVISVAGANAQQPDAPTGIAVAVDSLTRNLVTWIDEASASGETYNVYVSESPIVDIAATGVTKVGRDVAEGDQSFLHVLYTAQTSGPVSYYYAVTSVSALREENVAISPGSNATTNATENDAIATGMIALISTPVVIDGDIGEFTSQTIPFLMDDAHGWVEGDVTDDADLSAKAYVMVDSDNLYFAGDITDESLVQNFSGFGTWNGDSFELHVGLYPLPAKLDHNQRFKRASEPDYQFRLSPNEETWMHVPFPGRGDNQSPSHVVDYVEIAVAPRDGGYFLESRIPLQGLLDDPIMQGHPAGQDSLFVPELGMVLPIDFTLSDGDTEAYDGHRYYFWEGPDIPRPFQSPLVWSQAVIAEPQIATSVNSPEGRRITIPDNFALGANFPNPFVTAVSSSAINAPRASSGQTTIRYSLSQPESVSLKVFDILGREVVTLVQGRFQAGEHSISWNGRDRVQNLVAPGMYFYRLQVSGNVKTRKMLLLR